MVLGTNPFSSSRFINYIVHPNHYEGNLAGGAACPDSNCTKSLWLYTGSAEFDCRTDFHFCSQLSLTSRNNLVLGDLHTSRINIIQTCIQEWYFLSHLDLRCNLTLGGTPLFKQIFDTTNKYALPSPNIKIGKLLLGTSKIITWNMQGACNIDFNQNVPGNPKTLHYRKQELLWILSPPSSISSTKPSLK